MKIKTNLSPGELKRIGMGLLSVSDTEEIVLENKAEKELISKLEDAFDKATKSLVKEIVEVFEEEL